MKLKKFVSMFFALIFILTSVSVLHSQKVFAYDPYNPEWSFKINEVGQANRNYFIDGKFAFFTSNMDSIEFQGRTYDINSKEVAIQTELSEVDPITNLYVYVDDKLVPEVIRINLIDYVNNDGYNYNTFAIKYLTPGLHKIKIVAQPPYHYGYEPDKIDYLYVNIPVIEDQYIQNSIEKINSGTAALNDYEIVGVSGVTSDNLELLNSKLKGKNLTASNVQVTANELLDEIVKEDNMKQAYRRINAGTATLGDYILVGATNVTDINLADVNDGVKGKDNSTLSKLQKNINTIANALSYINSGSTSLSYYEALGITGVNSDNIEAISTNVESAKTAKGKDLTKAEIAKVVADTFDTNK